MRYAFTAFWLAATCAVATEAAAQTEAAAPAEAAAQRGGDSQVVAPDPWEGMNRDLFAVHEAVDKAVLEPVARGYRAITPTPVRRGVTNFLHNLRSPVILVNDLLQGEIERAGVTTARFGVNTTIGVGGVLDPATNLGLERHEEDFGQTLGVWGVEAGPYLFIPVLGPTSVRDGAGRLVDIAFDPLTWANFDEADTVRTSRTTVSGVSQREAIIETVDELRTLSMDPYVSIRTTYTLLRQSAVQNGQDDAEQLPNFDAIPDMPDAEAPAGETTQPPTPQDAPEAPVQSLHSEHPIGESP